MSAHIPAQESIDVEFKSDSKKLNDNELVDSVVAFANTNGGCLYLGVENDGRITGLHPEHRDITRLGAFISNKTTPPVPVRIEVVGSETPVLVVHVPKMRSIVASSTGKIQRRRLKADGSPENVPMYPHEISTRLSDLSLLDFSAQPVPGAQWEDLSQVERARLREIIQAYQGEQALLDLEDAELDQALRLVLVQNERPVPTYAGLLLLGKAESLRRLMPTAEVAYQALKGTEVSANESFYSPILAAIERIIGFVRARNPEQELEMGMFRMSVPSFDGRAVREAVVNAFAHRDYTRLGRVLVQIDDEGLTVSNPGGFIEGIDYRNLLTAEPHGRNPALADALKRIGLAERTGRGVDRIFEGSLRYGRDLPDYSASTSASVKLFIPGGAPDERMARMIAEQQRATGEPLSLIALFTLNALKQGRRMTASELLHAVNVPEAKLRASLERLNEAGLVEAVGNGRSRAYVLSAKAYDSPSAYVRQTGIEQLRHQELVVTLARKQGEVTRKDVAELLRVSTSQAYRLLRKLTDEGILVRKGETKAATYHLK